MTKKIKLLLISLGGVFLVGGCGEKGGDTPTPTPEPIVDPCPDGSHIDTNADGFCDICGYPVQIQHSTSISGDPTAPFYLKVGQTKTIKAKLSPSPSRAEEKTFTWKNSSTKYAKLTTDSSNTANAYVQGLSPGEVVFTATNDYNTDLVRSFNATVIDFNDDDMYLWEYSSDDRKQFGYENVEGKKQGTADGVARLGSMEWTYHRSATNSLQSNKGGIGFGKGQEPETLVTLQAANERQVKKITIETASAKSLANITVKVGDNEVINKKTPSSSDDYIGSVVYSDSTTEPSKFTGDISIQFDTPEFDPVQAEQDPNYQSPGAVYLKSIWIEYYEIEMDWKLNKVYDMEAKFLDPTDPFSQLTGTAKPYTLEDEETGVTINFEKVKKPSSSDKIQNMALTNGYIEILLNKDDEVLKKVSFDFINGTTANTYTESFSVFGGEPYLESNIIDSSNTGHVGALIKDEHANAVIFTPKTNNNVGIKSISVKTVTGENLEVDKMSLPEEAEPNKTDYKVGEVFDPAGLPDISVSFKNEGVDPIGIPADSIIYYDGTSYDLTPDHSHADIYLLEGTTYVVGYMNGIELKIEGISVVYVQMNFELVTDISEINNDDKYILTAPSYKAVCRGSIKDMNTAAAVLSDEDFNFGDTFVLPDCYANDVFNIKLDQLTSKYEIVNFDASHKFGVTAKGADSVAKDPKYSKWDLEIAESGIATISMVYTDSSENQTTFYLNFTGSCFKNVKDTSKYPICLKLYKLTGVVDPRDSAE